MLRWDWKYISMYFMKYLGFIVNELKHEKKNHCNFLIKMYMYSLNLDLFFIQLLYTLWATGISLGIRHLTCLVTNTNT